MSWRRLMRWGRGWFGRGEYLDESAPWNALIVCFRLRHDPTSGDITELPYGHMNLHSSDGSLLAVYYRHFEGIKNADGKVEVGKLDFFSTALGETEELHALIAVLGLTECRAMDEKNRNLPLKSGIFPNFVPGPIGYK